MEIEDNKLDNFFRTKTLAEGDEPGFDEGAWTLMENKLNKRDRLIFYKKFSAVLLLLCFIGFGTYFLNKDFSNVEVNQLSKNKKIELLKQNKIRSKKKENVEKTTENNRLKVAVEQNKAISTKNQSIINEQEIIKKNNNSNLSNSFSKENFDLKNNSIVKIESIKPFESVGIKNNYSNLSKPIKEEITTSELDKEEIIIAESRKLTSENKEPQIKSSLFYKVLPRKKIKTLQNKGEGVQWGLSFSLGPENNTVNGLGSGRTTLNGGMLVYANFKEKWTLSSGIVYGVKNYNANAQQYKFANTPRYQIDNIIASCDVLEIPLRASYQLAKYKKGSFYLNTGLSSLLMIKEQYTYQYNPTTWQPNKIILKNNANQHLLSVLELSTTYQFKLKGKSNLGISPFIKLPLGGIGEGEVNLKSTGINLNYNYDFTKKKK